MTQLQFFKYQGTGNDFVILDNRDGKYNDLGVEQVKFLCDRRFGVGADGLMLLNLHPDYDFEMKYYNADGRESSMCGNGGRCLTKFAYDVGLYQMKYKFLAVDGVHDSEINEDGNVALKMNDVNQVKYERGNFILNTGSPHFVTMINDVMHADVFKKGREIRYSDAFKDEGINVNFVQKLVEGIQVRTYERGVEDETLSCGTGVTAAAIAFKENETGTFTVLVETPGGQLEVSFDKESSGAATNVVLKGPAVFVFEGSISI